MRDPRAGERAETRVRVLARVRPSLNPTQGEESWQCQHLKKSTIVRLMNFGLAAAERIAPGLAARWVSRLVVHAAAADFGSQLPLEGGTPFEVSWEHGDRSRTVVGRRTGRLPGARMGRPKRSVCRSGRAAAIGPGYTGGHVRCSVPRRAPIPASGVRLRRRESSSARPWTPCSTKFGPAEAVVAHSMGGLATLLGPELRMARHEPPGPRRPDGRLRRSDGRVPVDAGLRPTDSSTGRCADLAARRPG